MQSLFKRAAALAATCGVVLCPASPAFAQAAAETPVPALDTGDTAWMLVSSILVLFMTIPGLALFYGGLVRRKNVLAVLMQCLFATGMLSVLWMVCGYSLAFTEGSAFLGGFDRFMLNGILPETLSTLAPTIPENVFVMFQCTFAVITPALIVGAPADRMKFSAMMLFLGVWLLLVYVPVAHMVWGPGGFLGGAGVLDFAGGTVVHINAAVAGLVAIYMIGKRDGYGIENMAPHNLTLTMTGAAMLWIGWFGFNAGSALASGGLAGQAMINTHTATAGAVVAWTLVEWMVRGKPSLLGAASGAVAGLVAITPACGFVSVGSSLLIGLLAGGVCYWGVTGLKSRFGYDDALDVWGVHGMGGILGAVLTGVFAVAAVGGTGKSGLIDGNPGQVLTQIEGVLLTIVWSGIGSFVILKVIDLTIGLRVTREAEVEGLDLALHGETVAH
jgi:Amt family ammonium transporter